MRLYNFLFSIFPSTSPKYSITAFRSVWHLSTHASPQKKLQLVSARSRRHWASCSRLYRDTPVHLFLDGVFQPVKPSAHFRDPRKRLILEAGAGPLRKAGAVVPPRVPSAPQDPDMAAGPVFVKIIGDERRPDVALV